MKKEIIVGAKRCSEHKCICAVECPLFGDRSCLDEFAKAIAEHFEKYRWHDLRKDPDDLPEEEGVLVLCVFDNFTCENGTFERVYLTGANYAGELVPTVRNDGCVPVAWREIEPYEPED